MKTLEYELTFTENTIKENAMPVIIVAAGASSRMKGIAKPFADICGIPVIVRTMLKFQKSEWISNIILVTRPDFVLKMQNYADEYGITKLSDIVLGGSCRQESVLNGLKTVKNSEKVLIHDGARPLVSAGLIENICKTSAENDCVICAVKSKDTVKSVNSNGFVTKTHNRNELYCVQTPQAVNVEKYSELLNKSDLSEFTDDASVFESAGLPVKVVEGEYTNIKITTPDDIALAEFYLNKTGDVI